MTSKFIIKRNRYVDSVSLMSVTDSVKKADGIENCNASMVTAANREILEGLGFDIPADVGANDLVVAVIASDEAAADAALALGQDLLDHKNAASGGKTYDNIEDIDLDEDPYDLVQISLPGEYAAAEAEKALKKGLDVFMFSDNVPIEREIELKEYARDHGLLMMGPDCGLSFINGVAVGLCSKVRRGRIGIAAACGSGMQEVMNIVHRSGYGISQAIGVGGRDLQDAVGGITMLQSIDILESDTQTAVIVLISKPPQPKTIVKILARVRACKKPVVLQLINADLKELDLGNAVVSATFEETANIAIALSEGRSYSSPGEDQKYESVVELARKEAEKMSRGQRYLRGIYCGGSLAEETLTLAQSKLGHIYGNIAFSKEYILADPNVSVKDCVIDIGAEEFTIGRPHVAIDPAPRIDRFLQEARDPETAVILMDFLLGYALCEDPAGMMTDAIKRGKAEAEAQGRHLCVIASICGSDLDPQNFDIQKKKLEDCGVIVMENNGAASRLASSVIAIRRELK